MNWCKSVTDTYCAAIEALEEMCEKFGAGLHYARSLRRAVVRFKIESYVKLKRARLQGSEALHCV